MNVRFKTTLILLATLLIGVIIGAAGTRAYLRTKWKQRASMSKVGLRDGFIAFNERILQPEDSQRDTLRQILDKYFEKFNAVSQGHRMEMRALIDSMNSEMDPILTEEQRERLAERMRRHGRKRLPFRDHPPPPHPPRQRDERDRTEL